MKRLRKILTLNLIIVIGVLETIFLLVNGTKRDGLDLIFLLPLVFSICLIFFRKIYVYHYGGLGFKVAYIIEVIRYLVLPVLISISDGEISYIRMSYVPPSSYTAAILIQCIEIIIFCTTIYYYYPIKYKKFISKYIKLETRIYTQDIRLFGWCMLGLFIIILLFRLDMWLPALNIFFLKTSTSSTKIVLENTLLSCVKNIILAYLVQKVAKYKSGTREYSLGFVLVVIWLLINSLSFFGTNRVYVIENILTSVMLVSIALPKSKPIIMLIVIPSSIALVFTMIVTKQFSLNTINDFSTSALSLKMLSNTVEEYVNGPWCIAQSYNAAYNLSPTIRFQAIIGDLTSGFSGIADLPIIKMIVRSTKEWRTASDIMKYSFETVDRGQMLSFSGGIFIWFGTFWGWMVFPIANFITTRILIWTEIKSKIVDSLYFKYMYIWMSILFGLTHCYCVETLLYCWSKFVLVYWLYLKINSLPTSVNFVIKKNRRRLI